MSIIGQIADVQMIENWSSLRTRESRHLTNGKTQLNRVLRTLFPNREEIQNQSLSHDTAKFSRDQLVLCMLHNTVQGISPNIGAK